MAEDDYKNPNNADHSCFRRMASKFNGDEWLNLVEADSVSEEELHNRLEQNWTAVAGVSGLITGFTYVVTNSDITFTHGGPLSTYRHDLFGFFSMLSFLTALQSLLFSAGLFGMVNLLGVESTNWFIKRNWWIIDVPLVCCMSSIGLMLVSAIVSIGGLVNKWVYYTILVLGIGSFLCFACIFFRVQRDMYSRTLMLKNKKKVDDHIQSNKTETIVIETHNTNVNKDQ
eukprot:170691_1